MSLYLTGSVSLLKNVEEPTSYGARLVVQLFDSGREVTKDDNLEGAVHLLCSLPSVSLSLHVVKVGSV